MSEENVVPERSHNLKIFKYPLAVVDVQAVTMPRGAKVLAAQMQGETLCLWAEVDTSIPQQADRMFAVYGTGHPMFDAEQTYIGTVQMHGGSLVFHVFEIEAKS